MIKGEQPLVELKKCKHCIGVFKMISAPHLEKEIVTINNLFDGDVIDLDFRVNCQSNHNRDDEKPEENRRKKEHDFLHITEDIGFPYSLYRLGS